MGKLLSFSDGLRNLVSNLGTSKDKAVHGSWTFSEPMPAQLESAYRADGVAKKIIDIPAMDMLKGGWNWQADIKQIEALENEERRLSVHSKLLEAMIYARLYGGAGIYISDGTDDPSKPLNVRSIGKQGIRHLTVLTRYQLTSSELNLDPLSEGYGEPYYYTVAGSALSANVHPSRVVRFIGNTIPRSTVITSDLWGDSVLSAIDERVKGFVAVEQAISTLVQEASVDVYKIDGLASKLINAESEKALLRRFELMQTMKSVINGVVIDKEDDWSQKSASFSALPDILKLYMTVLAGVADIPATRLFGQSPQGMNATGESDERNYYDRIEGERKLKLLPGFEKLRDPLIRSALGERPLEIHHAFPSLWQMSEKEKADIHYKNAQTAEIYDRNVLVQPDVLRKGVTNKLVEDSVYPGLEAALVEHGVAEDAGYGEQITDAEPRTLYVSRKVENGADIIKWAKSQGFKSLLKADDLHVTIAFSRKPVDWMKVSQAWSPESNSRLTISEGGPRVVEPLGNEGAIVLHIAADELKWRHNEIEREAGTSWDYDEYQPHITLTYKKGRVNLDEVEPYRGKIVLGPELFEEIDAA